jgi:hypothetical protein
VGTAKQAPKSTKAKPANAKSAKSANAKPAKVKPANAKPAKSAKREKSTKPLGPSISKAVEAFDVAKLAALLAEPGAQQAADEEEVLGGAVGWPCDDEKVRTKVVRMLLDAGVSPDGPHPAILSLLGNETDEAAQLALLRELLDRGADPNAAALQIAGKCQTLLGEAQRRNQSTLVAEILRRGVREQTRIDALIEAIDRLGMMWPRETPRAAALAFAATIGSLDLCGRSGLAPLHAAVVAADDPLVTALLARASATIRVAAPVPIRIRETAPPGSPIGALLDLHPGHTALDIATMLLELLEARESAPESPETSMEKASFERGRASRQRKISSLHTLRAALTAAGATPGTAELPPQPDFKSAIDASLLRLSALAGAKQEVARKRLAALGAREGRPWSYACAALETLKLVIDVEHLDPRGRSLLVRAVTGRAFDDRMPVARARDMGSEDSTWLVDLKQYPAEARPVLSEGMIVAADGDDLYVIDLRKRQPMRICVARRDSFSVLAESVVDLVRDEIRKLGEA